ncbi:MAG: hypothetical protein ACYC4S_12340 [Rhodoferax sp.]
MKKIAFLLLLSFFLPISQAQEKVPNLGEKVCALWTAVSDRAKTHPEVREQLVMMDWWALGYLKGMATQYAFAEKIDNPLTKLRDGEDQNWMLAFCRINPKKTIADAALELLKVLDSRS